MRDPESRIATIVDSYRGERSEDRLIVLPSGDGWIIAVADGVGGRSGGGDAAEAAVQIVAAHARSVSGGQTNWSGFLVYVDAEVASVADGGETTFVVLETDAGQIRGASAGDSEAWFITESECIRLTQYKQRKPFVGSGAAVPMSFTLQIPETGGALVVATDGLFHHANNDDICRIARLDEGTNDIALQLVDAARGKTSRKLHDDIAVVVCRVAA